MVLAEELIHWVEVEKVVVEEEEEMEEEMEMEMEMEVAGHER